MCFYIYYLVYVYSLIYSFSAISYSANVCELTNTGKWLLSIVVSRLFSKELIVIYLDLSFFRDWSLLNIHCSLSFIFINFTYNLHGWKGKSKNYLNIRRMSKKVVSETKVDPYWKFFSNSCKNFYDFPLIFVSGVKHCKIKG